jgi:hypothetical protein
MDDKRMNLVGIAAVACSAIFLLYLGSYLLFVRPGGYVTISRTGEPYLANYAVGGDVAARVFWPLERLDRRIRPNPWLDSGWVTYPPLDLN